LKTRGDQSSPGECQLTSGTIPCIEKAWQTEKQRKTV
jgi:hypothetical protein